MGRRPDDRYPRGQTNAQQLDSRGLRLPEWTLPSGAIRGSLRYSRARVSALQLQKQCLVARALLLDDRLQVRTGCPLDASAPGADRGIAAAVGMEERQRVRGARFRAHGDQHAAAASQCLEDSTVVRLKSDAA